MCWVQDLVKLMFYIISITRVHNRLTITRTPSTSIEDCERYLDPLNLFGHSFKPKPISNRTLVLRMSGRKLSDKMNFIINVVVSTLSDVMLWINITTVIESDWNRRDHVFKDCGDMNTYCTILP